MNEPILQLYGRSKASHRAAVAAENNRAAEQQRKYRNFFPLLGLAHACLETEFAKEMSKLSITHTAEALNKEMNTCLPNTQNDGSHTEYEFLRVQLDELLARISGGNEEAVKDLLLLAADHPSLLDLKIDFLEIAREAFNRLLKQLDPLMVARNSSQLVEAFHLRINERIDSLSTQVGDPFERLLMRHLVFYATVTEYSSIVLLTSTNTPTQLRKSQQAKVNQSTKLLRSALKMLTSYRKTLRR